MSELVVDPLVYSSAAASLNSYACTFQKIFADQMAALRGTDAMGGNVGASKDWATSYDKTVTEATTLTQSLIEAMGNYANVLQASGYNYALADHEEGSGRAAPVEPVQFPPAWASCVVPPPSAGGPGSGLFDDVGFAVSALEDFGVSIPDGEPDKLQNAADVWSKFASADGAGNLPALLEGLANDFETETAPDLEYIDEDIREMKSSAESILGLYAEIAQSCRDHKAAIDSLREKLKELLRELAEEIALEIATSVAFSIVAGALTAGFGAAAVAAAKAGKIALKVKNYASRVGTVLAGIGFKVLKALEKLPANIRSVLQRLRELGKKIIGAGTPKRPNHVPEGWEVRRADNGKGWVWQKPGSKGNANMFRDAEPTAQYPNGYVRFYNEHGQPIGLDGKPGSKAATHIPKNPDGSFPTPQGW